ncbi:MAG: RNase adapter RapZ [Elusimicrobia bacterium]|nr:RNase adapter RapZ [Candidatus Obscuribacterium magneticum]
MKPPFHCIIITGMSGAGKSVALHALEDLGLLCVDNLPLQLLPKLVDLYYESGSPLKQIAVGVDVRIGVLLDEVIRSLQDLSRRGITYQVLFLEASDGVLTRRFSETRRRHPLGRTVGGGIREERRRTKVLREIADRIIDTSHLNPNDLKNILIRAIRLQRTRSMAVTVTSFGYKYGVPIDADMVFDVRFLPNPNYVPSLKKLTGFHRRVIRFVLSQRLTKKYMEVVKTMLDLTVPQFQREGKSYLTLAVGCTGGRHRSVVVADVLKNYLSSQKFPTRVIHRDMNL